MDKIKLVINLLPILISLIKSVEAAMPEKGQGAVKLIMVREIMESIDGGVSASWPLIETAINAIVKAFNLSGAFKK